MILQSLVTLYDDLVRKNLLALPGWEAGKVTCCIELDGNGQILDVIDIQEEIPFGKKTKLTAQVMNVPAHVKRTVGIAANFLCDNASYIFGLSTKKAETPQKAKEQQQRAKDCFSACRQLHLNLLEGLHSPAAVAVRHYFRYWQPEQSKDRIPPAILELLASGGNLVFRCNGVYAHEDPEIREAWNTYYNGESDAPVLPCLVTGKRAPIAILHPAIKGVKDASSVGASLVSFNSPAFESYGQDGGQGRNAPVSSKAAFAYGAALQWLVSNPAHRVFLGDMTVVFWAENADEDPVDFFSCCLDSKDVLEEDTLREILRKLADGQVINWRNLSISPSNHFYILALSPNAGRISVRFFLQDHFGAFASNLLRHYSETEMVHAAWDKDILPLWALLKETVNQKATNPKASPQMAGDMLHAILTGQRYPATLMNQTQIRIRAETGDKKISYGRAAIIKAYLTRNTLSPSSNPAYREVLTSVKLNEKTDYSPYVLGRLFAVLENLQETANPGINATIRDRYFNSACATPSVVFPRLITLAQAHLKKVDTPIEINFSKQLQTLMGMLHEGFPNRLNLQDQGIFQLGYYHERQNRFTKKEEKQNV